MTELFPVSSLGHSVLIPALIGGSWAADLNVSATDSPYLAFIVGLHVATALALLTFFWRDWLRIIGGLVSSVRYRELRSPDQRLAWMLVLGTIPVGLAGLALDHVFRTVLGKPIPAAFFLAVNGLLLYRGERLRRRDVERRAATAGEPVVVARAGQSTVFVSSATHAAETANDPVASDARIADRRLRDAVWIGAAQILALLPGISRSGATMVAGLRRGLSHEDAARFSFLLATPVIFAAGVFKAGDLFGPAGHGIHGQVLIGSIFSFLGAYVSVRFLTRYFETRTLTPFAIYCALAGVISLFWLGATG